MAWNEFVPSTDFLGSSWIVEIQYVVDILTRDSTLHVTLEASVGIEFGVLQRGWDWLDTKVFNNPPPPVPLGRTPAARKAFGHVMDARARRVRDELVLRGIAPERITLSRGSAEMGAAGRKVEFIFDRR